MKNHPTLFDAKQQRKSKLQFRLNHLIILVLIVGFVCFWGATRIRESRLLKRLGDLGVILDPHEKDDRFLGKFKFGVWRCSLPMKEQFSDERACQILELINCCFSISEIRAKGNWDLSILKNKKRLTYLEITEVDCFDFACIDHLSFLSELVVVCDRIINPQQIFELNSLREFMLSWDAGDFSLPTGDIFHSIEHVQLLGKLDTSPSSRIANLDFLARCPQINSLTLRNLNLQKVATIGELKQLLRLGIFNSIFDIEINAPLSRLPKLESISFSGHEEQTLFNCCWLTCKGSLERLTVSRVKLEGIECLYNIESLTDLVLMDSVVDFQIFELLEEHPGLRRLVLYDMNISNFSAFESIENQIPKDWEISDEGTNRYSIDHKNFESNRSRHP